MTLTAATLWQTEAFVLTVDHRTCRSCGGMHAASNPRMQVRLRAPDGSARLAGIEAAVWGDRDLADLPREVIHVRSEIAHCHQCFERTAPRGTHVARRLTVAEIDAQRRTGLPDFDRFE